MALFDKALGPDRNPLSATEAFAAVAYCAMSADGIIADEELENLRVAMGRMRLFSDPKKLDLGLRKAIRISEQKGNDELLRAAAAAVPGELRATAFAIATDLVLADRMVTEGEETSLERIQAALGVPDDLAQRIVEVLVIKNKG